MQVCNCLSECAHMCVCVCVWESVLSLAIPLQFREAVMTPLLKEMHLLWCKQLKKLSWLLDSASQPLWIWTVSLTSSLCTMCITVMGTATLVVLVKGRRKKRKRRGVGVGRTDTEFTVSISEEIFGFYHQALLLLAIFGVSDEAVQSVRVSYQSFFKRHFIQLFYLLQSLMLALDISFSSKCSIKNLLVTFSFTSQQLHPTWNHSVITDVKQCITR